MRELAGDYRTIKALVFDFVRASGGHVDYRHLTKLVQSHFPASKWKKPHWIWYRHQILCGRFKNEFTEKERSALRNTPAGNGAIAGSIVDQAHAAIMKANGDLRQMSVLGLLHVHAAAIDELRCRNIIRSKNNPVGDYCEWLVASGLGLTLSGKSTLGYDAVDAKGLRYQIKGRRITSDNTSRQLSSIRNLANGDFDFLIAVLLDADFRLRHAYQIPHAVIRQYARFSKHTNAHILHLQGKLLQDSRVSNITAALAAERSDPVKPDHFEVSVGGYMGKSYNIRLEDGQIVYKRFDQGYQLAGKEVLDPAQQEWRDFLAAMDALKVWEWEKSYSMAGVMDGTSWRVDIALGDKQIQCQGSNAFPTEFKSFCEAVSNLLGGRKFA